MVKKRKNLGDYLLHKDIGFEFLAFIRQSLSKNSSNFHTTGNMLGRTDLGILVRNYGEEKITFYHKKKSIYGGDSDIARSQSSELSSFVVVNEIPLSLETWGFDSGWHLKKNTPEFKKARELLKRYGIY